MKTRAFIAASLIAALCLTLAPAPRALADGAASTRNILIGIGAAAGTLIIINHNKKVHQKYAEDAQKQAATAAQRDDAQAAYRAEVKAYDNQLAVSNELKREVAIKDQQIDQQKTTIAQLQRQLADLGVQTHTTAAAPAPAHASNAMAMNHTAQVVSYGWGTI